MAVELLQYKIELDATEARNAAAVLNHDLDTQQQIAKQVGEEFDAATKRIDAGFKAAEKAVASFEKAQTQAQQKAQAEAEKTTSILTKMAGVIGTGAFIAAIKSAADYADRLGELSQQTGIGVVALQKFDAAARLNGSNLEQVSKMFGTFQDRLAGGDKSVVTAINNLNAAIPGLGLSLDGLKKLSPEDQMLALAQAVAQVPPGMQQANIVTDLFGGTARRALPTLIELAKNYGTLPAMSKDVVDATGSLADQWDSLTHTGQVLIVQTLAPLVKAFGDNQSAILNLTNVMPSLQQGFETYVVLSVLKAAKALVDFGIKIGELEAYIPGLSTVLGTTSGNMQKMREDSQYLSDTIKGMQQPIKDVALETQKHGLALVEAAGPAKTLAERLAAARSEVAHMTDAQKSNVQAGMAMGDSVKDIAKSVGISEAAVKLYEGTVKANAKSHGDLTVALDKTREALGNLTGKQIAQIESGLALHDNLKDIARAAGTTVDVVKLYESNLKGATTAQREYAAEVKKTEQFQHELDMSLKSSIDQMKKFNKDILDEAEKGAKRFDDLINKEYQQIVESNKTADDNIRQITMTSLDYQLDAIKRAGEEKKKQYRDDSVLAQQAREAIDRETASAVAAFIHQHDPLVNLFKDMREQVVNLGKTVTDNFAAMLTGAESFGEGFSNIWHALRDTATSILADILAYYEKVFLVRLLAGAAAGGGGWTQALAGAALSSAGGMGGGGAGLAQSGIGMATTGAGVGGGVSTAALGTAAAYGGSSIAGGVVGYTVGRATGSAAKGALAGAATGAAYGSVVPGGGTAVGAIVGAIAGAWGAHKANEAARNEMVAIRDQIKEQFGNLDAARQAAQAVGVDLDKAFANIGRGVEGVKQFNEVIADFEKKFGDLDGALKHYGLTLDQVREMSKSASDQIADGAKTLNDYYAALTGAGMSPDAALKTMAGDFNALLAQAIDTGAKLPATMEPFLQKMNELGLITDANRDKLLGLSSSSTVDMQAMEDVAKRYGLTLESLGDKFNAAKLTEDARQVAKDFKVLQDGGADIGAVLEGMKPKFQDLVSASMKLGTELPDDLKDPIAYLIQMGMLTDQNGEKLTDLGQLKFGKSMADEFQPVTDAIHELIDVLTGKGPNSLPGAFANGMDQISGIARNSDVEIPVGFRYETFNPPVPGAAHGGYVTDGGIQYLAGGGVARVLGFRPRGTDTVPAMLTPGEGVLSRRGMAALGALNRGDSVGSITIEKGAIVVNGSDDPEATAEAIMRKLRDRRKYGRKVA